MHAFLLVGNNTVAELQAKLTSWHISPWDIVRPAGAGIADIRAFCSELSLTPTGKHKAGIIEQMERLTPEAQNALLKTLEEPPPNTYIVGTTKAPELLLPTILSRMQIIRLTDAPKADTSSLLSILDLPVGKRLVEVEKYTATRDDAKQYISDLLAAAQKELRAHPSTKLTILIRNLLAAQSQLSVNVNQKLVLDNALLNIHEE